MAYLSETQVSVEAMALHYGITPNTRGVFLGLKTCLGCIQNGCLKCPLHFFAMERLLRKYCDFMTRRGFESHWEELVAMSLKNFGSAFLGISHSDYHLQHGRFKAHYQSWVLGKHVSISRNESLKQKFGLHNPFTSNNLPYPCVFRIFGRDSFFVTFDDGKFFLLGDVADAPGKTIQFYQDFIEAIDKELTIVVACTDLDFMNI